MVSPGKKSFPLRIDPKLFEAIERWAADDLRSVNGHIEFLLREAAFRAGRLSGSARAAAGSPTAMPPAADSPPDSSSSGT
ncbi:hypothetical protein [Paenibacillus koleovorans]|uniref:hypothetical protein n=1 Tax=Paenibacillus koleovorans TaxID=121608 RepID=UPI000FD8F5AA|nr:hypothetical protein [Paenibacillus koleovorans]